MLELDMLHVVALDNETIVILNGSLFELGATARYAPSPNDLDLPPPVRSSSCQYFSADEVVTQGPPSCFVTNLAIPIGGKQLLDFERNRRYEVLVSASDGKESASAAFVVGVNGPAGGSDARLPATGCLRSKTCNTRAAGGSMKMHRQT